MSIKHVISFSGGKDSLATLLIARARFPRADILTVFCDTGNEHEDTYAYLGYIEQRLGIRIVRLRANFDEQIAVKRMFVARDQRTRRQYELRPKTDKAGNIVYRRHQNGEPIRVAVHTRFGPAFELDPMLVKAGGRKVRWTNKGKRRAIPILQPTGNPFLDLCLWKGRFPSRKAQFCTEELKRNLAVEFQMNLEEQGHTVVSWQGVRRDESLNRRNAKTFERIGPRMYIYRPIAAWTAMQAIAMATDNGVESNPLYRQGMGRVGCMPCINVGKDELRQIAARFPEHPSRISDWEWWVGQASKRGFSTFMADGHDGKDRREVYKTLNIWSRIEWAKTTRGGTQYNLLDEPDGAACSSAYGLCE